MNSSFLSHAGCYFQFDYYDTYGKHSVCILDYQLHVHWGSPGFGPILDIGLKIKQSYINIKWSSCCYYAVLSANGPLLM